MTREKELERQIKIKDGWCEYIIMCLAGYDGYENSLTGLRSLVDEAIEYASRAINCDDKTRVSVSSNGKNYNILDEIIEEGNED